jgi:hypothetical protein
VIPNPDKYMGSGFTKKNLLTIMIYAVHHGHTSLLPFAILSSPFVPREDHLVTDFALFVPFVFAVLI